MEYLKESRHRYLPKLFWKKGFRVGAEIGVSRGRYDRLLCQQIPKLKLYCVDPWLAYDDGYIKVDQPTQDSNYLVALERLKGLNYEIIKLPSMEAVKKFADGSLDFVFIDGNHDVEHALEDYIQWSKKVRSGGIVSGHDFNMPTVREAVLTWAKVNNINNLTILTNNKAITWMWIK